uniref:BOK n=1 Tax=Drosophila melanogaster TaxID=7227 RepID=Q95U83_DROME|nr:BOK [Drosophila melanogaster]AAL13478.1 GH01265p [Drosophila melanogaster]
MAPTTSPPPKLAKFKSSSLDHEIYTANRRGTIATASSDWKALRGGVGGGAGGPGSVPNPSNGRSLHAGGPMTRAASTSSLASSTRTMTNYQEYKMDIINQGKCLCGQYIRARLRRAGVLNRKVTQRLRNILDPGSSHVVYEVFPALNSMGEELERMHPRVYTNISRQLSRAPFGELEDSDMAPMLLNLVAKDLFRSSITWGKIISIFAVCGGFAIDCVRQGHFDYLQCLIDGLAEIIGRPGLLADRQRRMVGPVAAHPTPGRRIYVLGMVDAVRDYLCRRIYGLKRVSAHWRSTVFAAVLDSLGIASLRNTIVPFSQ